MSNPVYSLVDADGNEWPLKLETTSSWSVSIARDADGSLLVRENGEPVDEVRAVELYGNFGGVVGWSIMDEVDPGA